MPVWDGTGGHVGHVYANFKFGTETIVMEGMFCGKGEDREAPRVGGCNFMFVWIRGCSLAMDLSLDSTSCLLPPAIR